MPAESSPWIAVADRRPAEMEQVIVTDGQRMTMGTRYGDLWITEAPIGVLTHWHRCPTFPPTETA